MVNALDANGTLRYLKTAMELEISVYTQEQALKDAEEQVAKNKPVQKKVKKELASLPSKPTMPEKPAEFNVDNVEGEIFNITTSANTAIESARSKRKSTSITVFVIGGVLILFGLISIALSVFLAAALLFLGAFLVYCGVSVRKSVKNDVTKIAKDTNDKINSIRSKEAKYYEEVEKYNRQLEKYNNAETGLADNQKKMDQKYQNELEAARADYKMAKKRYGILTDLSIQISDKYNETKDVLASLYALDVLYPKYRNLIAVSTIYEYFASGRVNSLEGADGAYNLYESELRLDLIINKFDVVISNLESIRDNQYMLYNEIKQSNILLSGISQDISQIVIETKNISDNTKRLVDITTDIAASARESAQYSKITAYYSQVTAQNTEAIKYISLVNG